MPKPRNRLLARIAEIGPPVVRERVIPALENHVLPVLSHLPRPVIKGTALYVLLQIMVAESSTVQGVWARTKYHTPRPVHSAVAAAGATWAGGALRSATLAIRETSNRVFHPLRVVHADQEERGATAGEGLMQLQKAIDEIGEIPVKAPSTLDEVMKEIEGAKASPPRR